MREHSTGVFVLVASALATATLPSSARAGGLGRTSESSLPRLARTGTSGNKKLALERTRASAAAYRPRVALVDDFEALLVQLAPGNRAEPHGRLTEAVLQSQGPDIAVQRFQCNGAARSVARALRLARRQHRGNSRFAAVVVSSSSNESLRVLSQLCETTITGQNIGRHAQSLRRKVAVDKELAGVHRAVEAFTRPWPFRKPVTVLFPAGNEGPDKVNLYSLARGAVAVGAEDRPGKPCPESGNNALCGHWAQGVFAVRRVVGGYNLTGGAEVQLRASDADLGTTKATPMDEIVGCTRGTSLSCAAAAGAFVRQLTP